MQPPAMLSRLAVDGAALSAAAGEVDAAGRLDDPAPTCPGWTVRDVVEHTAVVYAHKATIIGGSLDRPPADWPPTFTYDDVREFYDEQLHRVMEALRAHDPATTVWTWYPPEQNVGFWIRRMMQETVIHRADVESAIDRRPEVPDDVAVDGINELLELMVCNDEEDFYEGHVPGQGQRVAIAAADSEWTVTLGPKIASFTRQADADADASLRGDGGPVLLALWNRLPYSAVTATGDESAFANLRALVAEATQ